MVKYSHMFKPKRLIVWSSLVSLVLPLGVSAATPQQIFGKSVDETFKKDAPLRVDAKMSVKVQETVAGKAKMSDGDLRLMLRYRQAKNGIQDSEGRLVIERAVSSGGDSLLPQKLDAPLAIEWKSINKTAYFRIKADTLPAEIEQQLGSDVMKLMGQWMMLEPSDAKQTTQSLSAEASQASPIKLGGSTGISAGFMAELKKLQVAKVDKVERRKNGDLVYRLRLRINPAELAKAEKARLAAIAKDRDARLAGYAKLADAESAKRLRADAVKQANESIAAAKKDFAQQREDAKHFWFAATVNATKNTLERLELNGWTLEKTEATKYAKASQKRTEAKMGLSLSRDGDWEVVKPSNALDFKAVLVGLFAQAMQKAADEAKVDAVTIAPSSAPATVVGLTHEFIETAAGYKVGYPDGWNSSLGQGSFTVTSPSKEAGIPPELAVWSFDAISGLDEDAMIQSAIGQVRDNLLLTAVEQDGWTYTLTAPEAVTAKTTLDGSVAGKSFLMTRNTDLGVIVTRIRIFPNVAGDKYLAVMFHEPSVPSAALERTRDAMLDSFTVINPVP